MGSAVAFHGIAGCHAPCLTASRRQGFKVPFLWRLQRSGYTTS